jgi:hypothetical protein
VPELLSHGAEAYGFRGEFWTCARVATGLWEAFGVSYHKAHVSRLLKRLDWTPQLPIERAAQRDEAVIKQWRAEAWPELKKRRASKGEPLSLWMSRAFISSGAGPHLCALRADPHPAVGVHARSCVGDEWHHDGRPPLYSGA